MKKKIIGLAALSLIALSINAQTPGAETTTTEKPVSIQIRAGVNFQNLNGKSGGDDIDGKLMTAFHGGVEVPIMIAPEFYIQPGVLYSMKGAKADNNSDIKTSISYLEVPVNFIYKPLLGAGHLILGVGPYLGIGIGGKIKGDGEDMDIKFKKELSTFEAAEQFAGSAYYLKRTDFGGNLLVGYELPNNLFFQLNAQLGLTNIAPKIEDVDEDDYNLKNTGFGLSVGYRF